MPETKTREKALHAIAKTLYADTMLAEAFDDLFPEEKAHYYNLAEQCLKTVESLYDLHDAQVSTWSKSDCLLRSEETLKLPDKPIPFRDLSVGQTAIMIDRLDDGDNNVEIRVSLYRRAAGVFSSTTEPEGRFIPSYYLGMIQGEPDTIPRHTSINDAPALNATSSAAAVFPVDIASLKQIELIPKDRKASASHKSNKKHTEIVLRRISCM